MSCYWNCCSGRRREPQSPCQAQAQNQTQDQDQKNVFREIGNVNIKIDNENIAVAVLAILAFLTGSLDGDGIRSLLDRFTADNSIMS